MTTELFGPSAYDMGRQASPDSEAVYKLNLGGLVQHNRFKLSCSYCSDEYEEERYEIHGIAKGKNPIHHNALFNMTRARIYAK
ncbi:hypothetical protein ACEQPO_02390 [Bacillus sp. SL00103]